MEHLRGVVRQGQESVYVQLERGAWERSEFPHELVILDFDERGVLLGFELLGSAAAALCEAVVRDARHDPV